MGRRHNAAAWYAEVPEARMDGEGLMNFHPLANIFPLLEGQPFAELVADIRLHGVREPVWLYEGQVLDGRNRWRAANEAGRDCPMREYEGDTAAAFVISLNLHRRHLTESQRGMVAARLANMPAHRPSDNSANLHTSQSDAAELLNVSVRTVATSSKVLNEAAPELARAVDRGDMSVSLAAQVAALPDDEGQLVVALNEDPQRMREVAREVVHNHRAQGSGENEWYTPAEYVEAVRLFMGGIDLDPASSEHAQGTVKAARFFTIDDDGLTQPWAGKVWLNPPYAQPAIAHFICKVVEELPNIDEAVVLTHNYTDTAWFHMAASSASAICFTRGRIGFLSPEGKKAAPTQGQAFFYFGERPLGFADAFKQFGLVVFTR